MSNHKIPVEEFQGTISPQKNIAGGASAIVSSAKHVFSAMNVVRGTKTLLRLNQKGGFDCPGCAWPDPEDHRSMTEFCENGAKAIAEEATSKQVTPEFFAKHSVAELAQQSDFWLGKQGRLAHPMLLDEDAKHYQPIAWEQAFKIIASELNSLASPDEATFYTSGRTSNEAAFLFQLMVRHFGTNNLPDCSNMCHESSGFALTESLGIGKGSVTLKDFDFADCIVVIGQNPGTNHPRMLTSLQKAARRGCRIVSINPLQEAGLTRFKHPQEVLSFVGEGTQLAHHFLPVKINGDVALLKGLMREMLQAEELQPGTVFNHEFIQSHTHGFLEFVQDLKATSWAEITRESGIEREAIREVAGIIQRSQRMIVCWAMGVTQHKNAVANIQSIVNLLLLGGHLGRPGAGACPVRGHSNVQGDRTMGIYEKMPDVFLDRLEAEFQFKAPRKHGLDTVESIKAMHQGLVKVFFAMGGNFLSATPDTELVAAALKRVRLTVQVSTKLNRAHLVTGKRALILPCLGRTEIDMQQSGKQFVSVEDSMGVVNYSEGKLKPGSALLKSEVAIVCGLAAALFADSRHNCQVDWPAMAANYDRIRDSISRVVPGFENFNERIRQAGGFSLPHPVRDRLEFRTKTKKANFTVHQIPKTHLAAGHFLLMTIRSHDQFNTTIYGQDDRYRGIMGGRRVIFMNEEDIKEARLAPGMLVDITSHFLGETRTVEKFSVTPYAIPRQCVAAYFPETNPLVPINSVADFSNTPTYKSIVVSLSVAHNMGLGQGGVES
jgi:molybdopterin-dependent oxidoreductase alpha subunit